MVARMLVSGQARVFEIKVLSKCIHHRAVLMVTAVFSLEDRPSKMGNENTILIYIL